MSEVGAEIGDKITLFKGKQQNSVWVTEKWENKEQLGGAYKKSKLSVETKSGNGEMKMVIKEAYTSKLLGFPSEKPLMTSSERYMEKWRILKEAGIPTVRSMRIVDEETVAMGDLTADGSVIFGRRQYDEPFGYEVGQGLRKKRPLNEMEEKLLAIDKQTMKNEVGRIAQMAFDKGIMLPDDDPFAILMHPDGKWEVIILDLSFLFPVGKGDSVDSEVEYTDEDVECLYSYLREISDQKE